MKYCSPKEWEDVAKTTHLTTAEDPNTIVLKSEPMFFKEGKSDSLTATCTPNSLAEELHNLRLFIQDYMPDCNRLTIYACTPAGCIVSFDIFDTPEADLAALCLAMLFVPNTAPATSYF